MKCRRCGSSLFSRGRGLHGIGEVATFCVLFCLGVIPGIVYYIGRESRPTCVACGRRA